MLITDPFVLELGRPRPDETSELFDCLVSDAGHTNLSSPSITTTTCSVWTAILSD